MTPDELMIQRSEIGAKYADLVRQVIDARIELMALDHITSSPIAHRHNESGFVGDTNELPRLLSHAAFAPFSPYAGRRLSAEIDNRIAELAASLRAPAA